MDAAVPENRGAVARVCAQTELGDAVALIGDNPKVLVLKVDDIPLMVRGRAVILHRYKSGGPRRLQSVSARRRTVVAPRRAHPHRD